MNEEAKIYQEPVEVAARLAEMNLSEAILQATAQEGQAFVDACTQHDPPAGIGMLGWTKTVRALRDRLVPLGWTYSNRRGYSITTHPMGQWSIAVCGGTSGTGRADKTSRNRAEKGIATKDAVRENGQGHFSRIDPLNFPQVPLLADFVSTWMLLIFADEECGEIRLELSLPRHIDAAGFVIDWLERIIVQPAEYGPSPKVHVHQDSDDDSAGYEVTIVRKEVSS